MVYIEEEIVVCLKRSCANRKNIGVEIASIGANDFFKCSTDYLSWLIISLREVTPSSLILIRVVLTMAES